ncbi:hypothetical protein M422DRAFT_248756 [Sphaerobolus stellatus SS14]|nr:hypothetical protein M422DRAFT_248756 [Sphaerobolus stellatus SS14]
MAMALMTTAPSPITHITSLRLLNLLASSVLTAPLWSTPLSQPSLLKIEILYCEQPSFKFSISSPFTCLRMPSDQ